MSVHSHNLPIRKDKKHNIFTITFYHFSKLASRSESLSVCLCIILSLPLLSFYICTYKEKETNRHWRIYACVRVCVHACECVRACVHASVRGWVYVEKIIHMSVYVIVFVYTNLAPLFICTHTAIKKDIHLYTYSNQERYFTNTHTYTMHIYTIICFM